MSKEIEMNNEFTPDHESDEYNEAMENDFETDGIAANQERERLEFLSGNRFWA